MKKLLHLVVALLVVACASATSSPITDVDEEQNLPVARMDSYEDLFDTVDELDRAADWSGPVRVARVESIGTLDADDPRPDEYFSLAISPLTGGPTMVIPWPAFVTDGTQRTMEIAYNGVATPAEGETLFVFVRTTTEDERQFFKGASHQLLTTDGIYRIVDGVLRSHVTEGNRISATLDGSRVDVLLSTLQSAGSS